MSSLLNAISKSQLAIEYGWRIWHKSDPKPWVFWVHAENLNRLEQSYRDLADRARIYGRKEPGKNIYKLVHDWMRDEANGKWLLIVDNADDTRLVSEATSGAQRASKTDTTFDALLPLADLPQSLNGSILITSRSKAVAPKLVEQDDVIEVGIMTESDALTLFLKKLSREVEHESSAELVEALEYMPLAIVQAAAYISKRAPRTTVQQYLENFKKNDRNKNSLLNCEGGNLRRDSAAKNSVIVTWQISFEHVQQIRGSAAELLSLMSFFDRQGIPENVLKRKTRPSGIDISEAEPGTDEEAATNTSGRDVDGRSQSNENTEHEDDAQFEEDVNVLRQYSFISVDTNDTNDTFSMHALVQLATRKWLELSGLLESRRHEFITNLSAEFPPGKYENWAVCQALYPHAKLAATHKPAKQDSSKHWSLLLYNAGWYAHELGNVADALSLLKQAADAYESTYGSHHNSTIRCRRQLGEAYRLAGKWKEAEELQAELLKTCRKVLGDKDDGTLSVMHDSGWTLYRLGRLEEAADLQTQILEVSKAQLGENNPNTLARMSTLALTYKALGRSKEAEKLQVLNYTLGPEHAETWTSMLNLAHIYTDQDRHEEAEKLELQVLKLSQNLLGEKDPETLRSMHNLAVTYNKQCRWDEAEKLSLEVIKLQEGRIGKEHPDTLYSMAMLAYTYNEQGRWDEAEELSTKVVKLQEEVIGKEHPNTLTSKANLAYTYNEQGRGDKAEELLLNCLRLRGEVLGKEHPETLTTKHNLAYACKDQGRVSEAIQLTQECMEVRTRVLGADHPDTLISKRCLNLWRDPTSSSSEAEEHDSDGVVETEIHPIRREEPRRSRRLKLSRVKGSRKRSLLRD